MAKYVKCNARTDRYSDEKVFAVRSQVFQQILSGHVDAVQKVRQRVLVVRFVFLQ